MKEGRVPRAVIKAVPSSKSLQFDFCTVVVNQLAGQQRSARAGIRRRAVIFRIAPELSNRSLAKGSGHPRQLDTVRFLLFFFLLFFFSPTDRMVNRIQSKERRYIRIIFFSYFCFQKKSKNHLIQCEPN